VPEPFWRARRASPLACQPAGDRDLMYESFVLAGVETFENFAESLQFPQAWWLGTGLPMWAMQLGRWAMDRLTRLGSHRAALRYPREM
jgi:hypothetical protein